MVNSGTAAIEVAFRAMDVEKKEVITTTTSCAPSANGIIHAGNTPVLVDVSEKNYNLDSDQIEKHITFNTAAIMPVHIYGRPCNMDKVMEIARKHNLPVIEDCAQSMGSRWRGKLTGTFGDVGCFSLNVIKLITTGEGGFIATNNPKIARKAIIIRNYGRSPERTDYCYTEFGHNYKFTNLQAALGLAQLKKIEHFIAKRRENAAELMRRLSDIPELQLPYEYECEFINYVSFPIVLRSPGKCAKVREFLEKAGVENRTMFMPMCDQPYYQKLFGVLDSANMYPNATYIGQNGFYVGCHPTLTHEQMDYMVAKIREAIELSR
jgi:perosamine synthetase